MAEDDQGVVNPRFPSFHGCETLEKGQTWKGQSVLSFDSFLSFDNDQIEIDAVKKSEDGKYIVIRFHEFVGAKQDVAVKPGFTWRTWAECDLRERPFTKFVKDEIRMSLHPYEIKTIRIEA